MRAVTLSDPSIIELLSTEVIPVWQSLGEVPKVTFELPDGRKLKRTLGGNIVTYLLSPDGVVYDALPGVYTPSDYWHEIKTTLAFLKESKIEPNATQIAEWHRSQFSDSVQMEKQRITFSKALVESPLLNALGMGPRGEKTNENFHDISKDPATVQQLTAALLKVQTTDPEQIGRSVVELDSKNNMKLMRPAVHLLLSRYRSFPKLNELRDRIYKDLLHVPLDDPYLGLADAIVPGSPVSQ